MSGGDSHPTAPGGVDNLVVAANGPGELAGWVAPFLHALAAGRRRWTATLVLWPCTFASGTEESFARTLPLVSRVLAPRDSIRLLLGRLEHRPPPAQALLHFGGEPLFSVLLARRLGCTALAYAEGPFSNAGLFDRIFVAHAQPWAERGRREVVGNLVADAVGRPPAGNGHRLTIGLLPGSRPAHVRHALPFLLEAARLASRDLAADFCIVRSPFVSTDELVRLAVGEGTLTPSVALGLRDGHPALSCRSGLTLPIREGGPARSGADLLVMLPGTATAEAAAARIPMIVVVPSNRPELLPWPGPLGWIDLLLPRTGGALKRTLIPMLARRRLLPFQSVQGSPTLNPLVAIPNLRAGREVVPEVWGHVTPERVSAVIVELGRNRGRLDDMGEALASVMGPAGAGPRMVERLEAVTLPNGTAQH